MFQAFFEKYEFQLALERGSVALNKTAMSAVVKPASQYSRQLQTCQA